MRALLIMAFVSLAAPDRPDPTPKKETPASPQQQLLGEWRLVKASIAGPPGIAQQNIMKDEERILVFTPTEIRSLLNGKLEEKDSMRYTVDWTKTPARIGLTPAMPDSPRLAGTLKLAGDSLALKLILTDERLKMAGTEITIEFMLQRVKR